MGAITVVIDTSAIIAIFNNEPLAGACLDAIEQANQSMTGVHVRLESVFGLSRVLGLGRKEAHQLYDDFLDTSGIKSLSLTDKIMRIAVEASAKFGKGTGHPAQLNFGDCMSYALAKNYSMPLLYIGNDFSQTDLKSVLSFRAASRT